jgi:hypothetical protein
MMVRYMSTTKMKIITISQSKSMPGSWEVTGPGAGGGVTGVGAYNAGDAAAKALVWAQRVGAPYAIVGHDAAIKLIPENARMKA